jgi:hypothetical protein
MFGILSDNLNNKNMPLPIIASSSNSITLEKAITQTAHGFVVGNWVYANGSNYALTDADAVSSINSIGVVTAVTGVNTFTITTSGFVTIPTASFVAGTKYYISGASGALTSTQPLNAKVALIAITATTGYVQQYEKFEDLKYQYLSVGTFTISREDFVVIGNNNISLTLPTQSSRPNSPIVIIGDWAPTGIVGLTASFPDSIYGTTTLTLKAGEVVIIYPYSDGATTTGWRVDDRAIKSLVPDTVETLTTSSNMFQWGSTVLGNSATAINLTLPAASTANIGKKIVVKNLGVGNVTVVPNGANVVNGQVVISQGNAVTYEITASNVIHAIADIASSINVTSHGEVVLNNQSFITAAFVNSTNGIYAIPSAGTWRLRYDISTDGSGVSMTQSMFAIIDSLGNIVGGTEKSRPGSSTSVDSISAEVVVVTTGPTNYYLKGRNGVAGAGTTTILNSVIAESTISWEQIGASPVPMDLAGEYGENNGITNGQTVSSGVYVDVTGSFFSLPTAGTWEVTYNVFSHGSIIGSRNRFQLTDSTGAAIANSTALFVYPVPNHVECVTQTVRITTASAGSYKLQALTDGGILTIHNTNTSAGGNSKIVWRKISGFIPSSGTSVDYIQTKLTAVASIANVAQDLAFGTTVEGNIPNASGLFTLTAGKRYEITANLYGFNFSTVLVSGIIRLVDSTNTIVPNSPNTIIKPMGDTSVNGSIANINFIFTPSVTGVYKLRADAAGAGNTYQIGASESSLTIKQLGSSNVIAGLYPGIWGTYVPTITAVTTNPTKPSSGIIIDTASYLIEGKKLTVNYTFWIGTAVAPGAGSGTYKFSLPAGIVIDTTKVTTIDSVAAGLGNPNIANIIGTVELNRGSQGGLGSRSMGHVYAADANNFTAAAMISAYGTLSMFDSAAGNAALQSGIGWKMQFTVPIV